MSQKKIMGILLNGIAQLEYDRSKKLSEYQIKYLDDMDIKMDAGIMIADNVVKNPDIMARVKFVTGNLLHALKGDDEQIIAAFCSYIATRMPDLDQIKIRDADAEISIELVFDDPYRQQKSIPITMINH